MHSGVVWREIGCKVTTNRAGNSDWCVQSTKSTLLEGEPAGVAILVMVQPLLVLHTSAPQKPLLAPTA